MKRITEMKMMKTFLRWFPALLLLLLALGFSAASAEVRVEFTPDAPRVGDYVDVTVSGYREGATAVRYALSLGEEEIFKPDAKEKPSLHYTASFRPRKEGTYKLSVTIVYGKKDEETAEVSIPVSGTAPVQEGQDVVYSQKDGWWKDVVYSKKHHRSLQKSGCAIFSLSHVLQRLGFTGSEVLPDALAEANSRFYINERGTDNPGLIANAAQEYGFITQEDLIETGPDIVNCLRRGDLLSFSIVLGHIAMADGVSEDGTLVHIVDSAVSATYERKDRFKTKGHVFYQKEDGSFEEAVTPDQIPGIRWFFETGEYGGATYWLDLPYCAKQGMRLVRKPWLTCAAEGGEQAVTSDYSGALVSKVILGEESIRIPTRDLHWETAGADSPQIALVTGKKGTNLLDGDKKTLARYSQKLPAGTMLTVLGVDNELAYVFWKDTFCYVALKDVKLLPVEQGSFKTGILSVNGKTSGTAKVTLRQTSSGKSAKVAELTIGTPAAVVAEDGDQLLVEAKGRRGWIQKKHFTQDDTTAAQADD